MAIKNNYISLQKINKTYSDGYSAVSDINLNINKGEFVTLLGPSGCGKTTILKMIAGFEKPTEGKIIIDEIDVKDLPPNKRCTATVFQDYALFPSMTVFQNIAYGIKLMRVPKTNIKEYSKELEQVKKNAEAFAKNKIREGNAKIVKLKKDLNEELVKYDTNPN
jgi:spermidine/putrescine transport system ATP-binding protein